MFEENPAAFSYFGGNKKKVVRRCHSSAIQSNAS